MAEEDASPAKPTLTGLAKKVEDDDGHLLASGTVFRWPSAKTTGIVNLTSLALNCRFLNHLVDVWVPRNAQKMRTVCVEDARDEVGLSNLAWY